MSFVSSCRSAWEHELPGSGLSCYLTVAVHALTANEGCGDFPLQGPPMIGAPPNTVVHGLFVESMSLVGIQNREVRIASDLKAPLAP